MLPPSSAARALFRRAVLLVAGHGAAMSNMVFMAKGSSVLEIRPRGYPNACYNSLAYVSQLKYHLMFGIGDANSLVDVDVDAVESLVREIMPSLAQRGINLMAS